MACNHVCTVTCPPSGGLDVGVVNDRTGEPICDATVTAAAGAYSEQLVPGGCRYSGAVGRPGIHSLRTERSLFQARTASNVQIHDRSTDCCEITDVATVEIRLVPVLVPERRGYGKSDGKLFREEVGNDVGTRFIGRLQAESGEVLGALDYFKTVPWAEARMGRFSCPGERSLRPRRRSPGS